MKPFDPTKPVQQRCGSAARIICTDKKGDSDSIVALILNDQGNEVVQCYKATGKYFNCSETVSDLINIPETKKIKFWVNVYNDGSIGGCYKTKKEADIRSSCRFACIEIEREVKEGEGL